MAISASSSGGNQPLLKQRFVVTIFPNNAARSKTEREFTLPELAAYMQTVTAPRKDQLPLIKLALFGDQKSDKGCLRTNANMLQITGIEVEHDAGTVSFKAAHKILRDANVCGLLYTTPSHIPIEHERWRILMPLSRPHDKMKRAEFVARVNGLFGGALARESFAMSQAFYFGSVAGQKGSGITLPME
jgi:hypothetical protein